MTSDDLGLALRDFGALGDYAPAGLEAVRLALTRAARSDGQRRIPIAGAAIQREPDGALRVVCVGNNGRIPAPDDPSTPPDDPSRPLGYPTDHGETAAIRQIADFEAVDWPRVVFATTLSPCVMCSRALLDLNARGLKRVVIAESNSFSDPARTLERLARDLTLVKLTNPWAVETMQRFARTYPWDWAADIGEIPPGPSIWRAAARPPALASAALEAAAAARRGGAAAAGAAVSAPIPGAPGQARIVSSAADARARCGGNPVYSAPMLAMGRAGASVNLRECAVAVSFAAPGPVDVRRLGAASLGALELFRPAALVSDAPLTGDLVATLEAIGIQVSIAGPAPAPSPGA